MNLGIGKPNSIFIGEASCKLVAFSFKRGWYCWLLAAAAAAAARTLFILVKAHKHVHYMYLLASFVARLGCEASANWCISALWSPTNDKLIR